MDETPQPSEGAQTWQRVSDRLRDPRFQKALGTSALIGTGATGAATALVYLLRSHGIDKGKSRRERLRNAFRGSAKGGAVAGLLSLPMTHRHFRSKGW